jgi:hypothetical protein
VIVARLNGVYQLINFLHRVPAQGQVILLAVSRAAPRRTQASHYLEKVVDGGLVFHFKRRTSNIEPPTPNIR